jgi:hypothetical protein
MNIEYITTKDYLYDEDGKLIDTQYSVDGIVYIYDGMSDDRNNIIDERPLTEEDDKLFEYHNSQYYLDNFDEFINYLRDLGNTVDPQGEVTLDDEGRVIKDKYPIEAGNVIVNEYEYDNQGRLIKIIRNSDDYLYSTSSFITILLNVSTLSLVEVLCHLEYCSKFFEKSSKFFEKSLTTYYLKL